MCGRGFGNFIFPALAGLLAAETLAGSQPTTQPVSSQAVCPGCHAPVMAGFEWCPRCGHSLRGQPTARVAARFCAYCGRALASGDQVCPSCGAPVGRS